jgi:hypothetical protein
LKNLVAQTIKKASQRNRLTHVPNHQSNIASDSLSNEDSMRRELITNSNTPNKFFNNSNYINKKYSNKKKGIRPTSLFLVESFSETSSNATPIVFPVATTSSSMPEMGMQLTQLLHRQH